MDNFESSWSEYVLLTETRPELFRHSDEITIITDKNEADRFYNDTGKKIGVVYKSQYNYFIVDLIKAHDGTLYTYERLVPANDGGVVAISKIEDRFILLKQYRHALRDYEHSFPRGYGEDGISTIENVRKELREEISAEVNSVRRIGSIISNSGISGDVIDVFLCEISHYKFAPHYEGIAEIIEVSENKLKNMISSGTIKDCFTISAFALYMLDSEL